MFKGTSPIERQEREGEI
jgi:hypothetical protein